MNSYNENLQNTVAATLQSQNLDLQKLESQNKSAMYSLYYAEGATITSEEKLENAKVDMDNKATIKEQAVKNTNISANQLNSSTQAGQYTSQAVTNMATCAANVQIAANGITRLAADVGSIFSIVNAADFGTDIYNLADQVKGLVNTTAYHAELTSQTAMEASANTAQVSTSTVLNDAKTTNGLMNNILKIASGEYNAATQTVASDNTILATASNSEKLAEGAYKSASIDLVTGESAYYSVNSRLNLDLTAIPLSSDIFLVSFNLLKAAFPPPISTASATSAPNSSSVQSNDESTSLSTGPIISADWYPVSQYYVFVVKESKKHTFSISEAENLRINNSTQYVKIDHLKFGGASDNVIQNLDKITQVIKYKTKLYDGTFENTLMDSDGDEIVPGKNYVVFVMAVYQDQYKRLINNFDDYLSAPSLPFCMTTLLERIDTTLIAPVNGTDAFHDDDHSAKILAKLKTDNIDINTIVVNKGLEDAEYILLFLAPSLGDYEIAKIGFKCMFLPVEIDVQEPLLTMPKGNSFIDEEIFVDRIGLQNEIDIINNCITQLRRSLDSSMQNDTDKDDQTSLSINKLEEIDLLEKKLDQLTAGNTDVKIKFFFNKSIAEIVSAGNYTPALKYFSINEEKENEMLTSLWYATIDSETTDNFGNLLSENKQYAIAILTYSNSDDINVVNAYTNNLSDLGKVNTFTYKSSN